MKSFRILCLVLLVCSLAAGSSCFAKSVQISTAQTPGISDKFNEQLLKQTQSYFTTQGYTVVESGADSDYKVTTSVATVKSKKEFSPIGCLACGIFGAAIAKSKVTITTDITDPKGVQLFTNSTDGAADGGFLFGLFQNSSGIETMALKKGLKQLYSAFILQNPPM